MKFILLLACLALFVAATHGQRRSCRGGVRSTSCSGPRNSGNRRGRACGRNANNRMWFYNQRSRSCERMRYLGCGGNRNRYCSLAECRNRCVRRGPSPGPAPGPPGPVPAPEPAPAPEPPATPEAATTAAPAGAPGAAPAAAPAGAPAAAPAAEE